MLIVNFIHNDTLVSKLASPLASFFVREEYDLLMSANISSECRFLEALTSGRGDPNFS